MEIGVATRGRGADAAASLRRITGITPPPLSVELELLDVKRWTQRNPWRNGLRLKRAALRWNRFRGRPAARLLLFGHISHGPSHFQSLASAPREPPDFIF